MRFYSVILICLLAFVKGFSQNLKKLDTNFIYAIAGKDTIKSPVSNSLTNPSTNSLTDEKHYIVRFKSSPILTSQKTLSAGQQNTVEQEHQLFESDLQSLHQKNNSQARAISPLIHHHFKNVFNGTSVSMTSAVAESVKGLSYVSGVIEDVEVKAFDDVTQVLIGADKVWSQFSTTGSGIRIGIIDTGIDYRHPALGSGFGPGFKVVGGYDFINNDNDPLDDNGHGTHVAGIAAANGTTIKGIAPGAKLYAYKVLDQNGSGYSSLSIAAIEKAVDPDQNPATPDYLDVINMSLGSPASNTRDFLEEAVNNASDIGIIFCIAAGNSGSSIQSIATPGIAEKAITVGASSNQDDIAPFSSRGPVPYSFRLKPDVTAPGVGVNSTFLGGGYSALNGTSMASPHVAGAAALLKSLHPDWTPEIVKAVLMESSSNIAGFAWDKGAGRIDLLKAAKSGFAITPGSLSIGKLDRSQPETTYTFPVKVVNLNADAKTVNLDLSQLIKAGVAATLSANAVTLNAFESKPLTLTVKITPTLLTSIPYPGIFVGKIVGTSGSESISSSVSFINQKLFKVRFQNGMPDILWVANTSTLGSYSLLTRPLEQEMELLIPDGLYDVHTAFGPKSIYRIEVPSSIGEISLDPSEAIHSLDFAPLDEKGDPIDFDFRSAWSSVNRRGALSTYYPFRISTLYFNTIPVLEFGFNAMGIPAGKSSFYNTEIVWTKGINQSMVLSNDPLNYTKVKYSFPTLPNEVRQISSTQSGIYFTPVSIEDVVGYYTRKKKDAPLDFVSQRFSFMHEFSIPSGLSKNFWITPGMTFFTNDSLALYSGISSISGPQIASLLGNSINFSFGSSIMRYNEFASVANGLVQYTPKKVNGYFTRALGDKEIGQVKFELLQNDAILRTDSIPNFFHDQDILLYTSYQTPAPKSFAVKNESYVLRTIYTDYFVRGHPAKATVDYKFNGGSIDSFLPTMSTFTLQSGGSITDRIENQAPSLFSMTNIGIVPEIAIRKEGEDEWVNLKFETSAKKRIANIPTDLKDGYYSLRIKDKSLLGNPITYYAEPAFIKGDIPTAILPTLLIPEKDKVEVPINEVFKWTRIDGALSYTIQLSRNSDFTSPYRIATSKVETHQFTELLDKFTTFNWRVRANYTNSSSAWTSYRGFSTGEEIVSKLEAPFTVATLVASPNPSSGIVKITYSKESKGSTKISILNMLGELINQYIDDDDQTGLKSATWDSNSSRATPGGVYVVILQDGNTYLTRKIVIQK
ncbi:MAG: S8 family serine peptidase [Cyclobacteriaceae bacterium]|nr:S8 family serine peptidase [Cyclobacteriaceae bacterium]